MLEAHSGLLHKGLRLKDFAVAQRRNGPRTRLASFGTGVVGRVGQDLRVFGVATAQVQVFLGRAQRVSECLEALLHVLGETEGGKVLVFWHFDAQELLALVLAVLQVPETLLLEHVVFELVEVFSSLQRFLILAFELFVRS